MSAASASRPPQTPTPADRLTRPPRSVKPHRDFQKLVRLREPDAESRLSFRLTPNRYCYPLHVAMLRLEEAMDLREKAFGRVCAGRSSLPADILDREGWPLRAGQRSGWLAFRPYRAGARRGAGRGRSSP